VSRPTQPPRRPQRSAADDNDVEAAVGAEREADESDDASDGEEGGAASHLARQRVPRLAAGGRRFTLALLVMGALVQAGLIVAAALSARHTLDAVMQDRVAAGVAWWWLAATAAALIGIAALGWWKLVLGERLAQGYIHEVRLAMFDTLATLSPTGRQRRSRGAVMLRFMGDAQALRDWAAQGAPGLAAAAMSGAALLLGLGLLAPPLAALAAAWFALGGLGMAMTLPPLAQRVREARLRQAYLAANVHDRIAAVPVMQSAAQSTRERGRLSRQLDRLTEANVRRSYAKGRHRWWIELTLSGLSLSVITVWSLGASGAAGWVAQFQGVGELVGALGLIALLAAPLRHVGRALEKYTAAEVAKDRIAEYLADTEPTPPQRTAPLPKVLVLRMAGLPLPQRPGQALATEVPHGRCIALLGPPGSGKTALLETLARLRPLAAGEVELGDRPLAEIGLREFSRRVSHVGGETVVLRGTVDSNLRYRRRGATDDELRAAAAAAGWPGPLDEQAAAQRVRDGGSNLGGSQRRALVLARALVGRPALLLVDDLEHLLESADRMAAFARLRQVHAGTLIFSTHDRQLAALADERWELGSVEGLSPEPVPLRLVAGDDS
jgi:ABC-type multidrug transport system fused ATPase/permease subunit